MEPQREQSEACEPETSWEALQALLEGEGAMVVPPVPLESLLELPDASEGYLFPTETQPSGRSVKLVPTRRMVLGLLTNPNARLSWYTRRGLEEQMEKWTRLRRKPKNRRKVHKLTKLKRRRDSGFYVRRDRKQRRQPYGVWNRLVRDARYRGIPWEISREDWDRWVAACPTVVVNGSRVPLLSLRTIPNPKVRLVRLDTSLGYRLDNIGLEYEGKVYVHRPA